MILRITIESSGVFAQRYATVELTDEEFDRYWRARIEAASDEMMLDRELRQGRATSARREQYFRVRDLPPAPAHVELSEEVAREAVEHNASVLAAKWQGFERTDTKATSTLRCSCGASFTWEGPDERLHPWLREHGPHVSGDWNATGATPGDASD